MFYHVKVHRALFVEVLPTYRSRVFLSCFFRLLNWPITNDEGQPERPTRRIRATSGTRGHESMA